MRATGRVGLFLDADNLLPWWPASGLLPDEGRTRLLRHEDFVAFAEQLERAVEPFGHVVVREAYGRWDNDARPDAAALLHYGAGFDLFHVPALSRTGLKNAGDIMLAARSILSTTIGQGLETVVVVAADSDYYPLVTELHSVGARVVSVSFPLSAHQAQLFDHVFDDRVELTPVPTWQRLERDTKAAGDRRRIADRNARTVLIRQHPSTRALADGLAASVLPGLPEIRGGVRSRLSQRLDVKGPRADRLLHALLAHGVLVEDTDGFVLSGPAADEVNTWRRILLGWLAAEGGSRPGSPEPMVRGCFDRFDGEDEAWLARAVTSSES